MCPYLTFWIVSKGPGLGGSGMTPQKPSPEPSRSLLTLLCRCNRNLIPFQTCWPCSPFTPQLDSPPHTHTPLHRQKKGTACTEHHFPLFPRSATGLRAYISPITNSSRSPHYKTLAPNCRVLSHPEKSSYLDFKIHDLSSAESVRLPISLSLHYCPLAHEPICSTLLPRMPAKLSDSWGALLNP